MRWLAALLILASSTALARDGYKFEFKEKEDTRLEVKIVVHSSKKALREAAERSGAGRDALHEIRAWSVLRPGGCTIHMLDPANVYLPEILGHELMHCIYGRWHT